MREKTSALLICFSWMTALVFPPSSMVFKVVTNNEYTFSDFPIRTRSIRADRFQNIITFTNRESPDYVYVLHLCFTRSPTPTLISSLHKWHTSCMLHPICTPHFKRFLGILKFQISCIWKIVKNKQEATNSETESSFFDIFRQTYLEKQTIERIQNAEIICSYKSL